MPNDERTTRRAATVVLALAVPVVALLAILATRAIEGPSSSESPRAGANAIVIENFAFTPSTLTVAKGTRLEVRNLDGATHTLTARDGSFDTGELGGGKTAFITLNTTGTFPYYCKIHNYMTGTVVVR